MPAASARTTALVAVWLALTAPARADIGATLSVQSDARDRGMSYSDNRPGVQLGLGWDGPQGWYAGMQLARARFVVECCSASLQAYGGHVFELAPGLDAEVGVVARHFASISRYDFHEVYGGLLGDRWNLRVYHSPDYYGSGERTVYGEVNLRWPVLPGLAAVGHAGVLRRVGGEPSRRSTLGGRTRADLRVGMSWALGAGSELQVAAVAAGRRGPTTWTEASRPRTVVLGLSTAF